MKFCTACGAKKVDSTPFCNECGEKFEVEQTRTSTNIPSFRALSMKTKIIIGAVLAVLIIGFGLYKVGDSLTDKAKLLATFTEHLENGDVKELVAMLDSGDESVKVTEQHVEDLLAFMEENPYVQEELVAQLRANSKAGGFSLKASAEYEEYVPQLITFEKRGKHFFLYDNYDFVLQTFPLTVYTNYEDLQFFVNDEEVKSPIIDGEYVSLGNVLPGNYKVKAVLSSDFVELEKEIDVHHFYDTYSDLILDIDYIDVSSNVVDATVLINEKDAGIKIAEDKEAEVGPVLLDGSMTVQVEKETPFGKLQSPAFPIDDYYMSANVILSDEQKEQVTDQLKTHLLNYSKALAHQDEKILKENSNTVSEFVQSEYEDKIDTSWSFAGYLTDVQVNLASFYVQERDNKWYITVDVLEKWNQDYVYSGDSISLSEETYSNVYEFIFDEKAEKWKVGSWSSSWGFDDSNMKSLEIDAEAQKKQLEDSPVFKSVEMDINTANVSLFMKSFVSESVSAINARDFSYVSDLIDPSSKDYIKEVSNYIDHLEEKGITEDILTIDIVDVVEKDDDKFTVSTYEEYYIHYGDDSSKYKAYNSKYEVRSTDDGLRMYKLIETKEVDSEDL